MSYGLTNALTTFMDLMNLVFRSYLYLFLIVFIDDILVYPKCEDGNVDYLMIVLQVLKDNQLLTKFTKCEFWLRSITFLDHIVFSEGVEVDPRKMNAVKTWPRPFSPTKIRRFLGLARYYRRFVDRFAYLTSLLMVLTEKKSKFEW